MLLEFAFLAFLVSLPPSQTSCQLQIVARFSFVFWGLHFAVKFVLDRKGGAEDEVTSCNELIQKFGEVMTVGGLSARSRVGTRAELMVAEHLHHFRIAPTKALWLQFSALSAFLLFDSKF